MFSSIFLRISLALFIVASLFSSCRESVESISPRYSPITQSVYASGVVHSVNQYQVFANASGILEAYLVREGDTVKKGQLLVKVRNQALELGSQNARLTERFNEVTNNQEKLEELRKSAALAQEQYINDSILAARQRVLWAQQVGTRLELEQRELKFQTSKIAYENANLKYLQMRKQIAYSADQSRKLAEISTAQSNELKVVSQTQGIVFSLLKEPGEAVTPQTPLAVVGEDKYFLELEVDEFDIRLIRIGQEALITMDAYKGQTFEGTVTRIYPIMNERTRSFTLEVTFRNPPEVYPQMTAEANIIITTKSRALLIPRPYLVDETFVVLRDGTRKEVKTGLMDYQQVEILSGLTDKDELILPAP